MWDSILGLFREYMGTGLLMAWFLVCLVYIYLQETRKPVRILFLYTPVILLLFFFNPLLAEFIFDLADGEIYYRILWLLPITMVIGFVIVDVATRLKGRKQMVFVAVAVVLIVGSGSYIYRNPYFSRAENLYHVPQSVADICDAIEVEGREVMAAFPLELIQYVRQYSPTVCMPYGREVTVDRWNQWNILCGMLEEEEVSAEALAEEGRLQACVYLVVPSDIKIIGNMSDYDFDPFFQTEGYDVYKDNRVNLTYFLEESYGE